MTFEGYAYNWPEATGTIVLRETAATTATRGAVYQEAAYVNLGMATASQIATALINAGLMAPS